MPNSLEGLFIFAVFVPGFIIYHAIDQYLTRERPTDVRLLLSYLTYSGIYLSATWTLLDETSGHWWLLSLYMVIAPLVIGLVVGSVLSAEWWASLLTKIGIHKEPYPTGWDAFFNRRMKNLGECHVIVTFRTGEQIMGLYSRNSSASEYPISNDLYLEKVYEMDKLTGKIGSEGVWLPKEEIRYIEFLKRDSENSG